MIDHDKLHHKTSVYVVGLPEVGGCWSHDGTAYARYEDANIELQRLRNKGHTADRIFTFCVYEPKP